MGIYIFNTETLLKALIADAEDPDSKHDFGHNILPNMLGKKKMMAYSFVDENKQQALYWRDVGTLDAYYDANMDLCSVSPVFNLYDKSWPIRTRVRQYPPAKFVFGEPGRSGMAVNSVITAGVIISGATVSNSVLSQDVRVNSYSDVDASIIFSHVNIGRHCRIRRAIIDRDVHIPEGTVIGYDPVEDKRRYFVTPSGLTIVTRDASLFENPVDPEFLQRYSGFASGSWVCVTPVAQGAGFHHHRAVDPGPGDRRQFGHLHAGQFCAAAKSTRCGSQDPDPHR
jgi:glucose-1-phosphate adenylyltransferase